MEMEKILKKVEEDKVRFVLLQFTDINGIVKNLTIDNYINENFNDYKIFIKYIQEQKIEKKNDLNKM